MARYESLQAILQEAGMSHQLLSDTLYGAADGTNKTFIVQHKPISDSNHDDIVDADDVFVTVNGTPVSVADVDEVHGVITLDTAPAANATVLVDYRYSSWTLAEVDRLRAEAQQRINDTMKQAGDSAPYSFSLGSSINPAHSTVRAMTRICAAAMLLIRDYGYNQDTELTSKDGFKKLELVFGTKDDPGMIGKFIAAGGVNGMTGTSSTADDFEADSAGELFGTFTEGTRPNSDTDFAVESDGS